MEWLPLLLFVVACGMLLLGFPVALTLGGTALIFASIGIVIGIFDPALLHAMPSRIFDIMSNQTLLAVPLFVFMGVTLEKTKLAETLLENVAKVFGRFPGGLAIAVVLVGALLAASTGIVGATVVAMGMMSLPTMLKRGYNPALACGTICATGTLGQIIPPSIALVLLGDVLSNAYQQAQMAQGSFNTVTISVRDLFMGALIPGFMLVVFYLCYLLITAMVKPEDMPPIKDSDETAPSKVSLLLSLLPIFSLILLVLGSIMLGIATPSEAAAVGAFGALLLAVFQRQLSWSRLQDICLETAKMTSMVFFILIGASLFSLVFRGYGGDEVVHQLFSHLPGGVFGAMLVVMLIVFLLGFILDFIEITFMVIPIVGPVLLSMGIDPIWLGIMLAINLQTSFLTPPFGFALFYLRGVAPDTVSTSTIYRGVMPFIALQVAVLILLACWPELATWLPQATK